MESRITKMFKSKRWLRWLIIFLAAGFTIMLLTFVYEIVSLNNEVSDLRNDLKPILDFYKEHRTFIENHKKEHESTMILPVVPSM